MSSPVVNVHTHFQPESVLSLVEPYGITMRRTEEGAWYFRSGSVEYSIPGSSEKFWGRGLAGQIADMDAAGVDVHVLSASPMIFGYHLPADVGLAFSRAFNDETARHIAEFPGRFWGSAQLPMQDLAAAAEELERAVTELGFRSCTVGFVLGPERTLADPDCDAFLATVERLNVPILLHPVALGQTLDLDTAGGSWLLKYQMDWAWGYLFVETVAVVGFVLGGALDRHPNLRVMVPHGGGMLPFPARPAGLPGEGLRGRRGAGDGPSSTSRTSTRHRSARATRAPVSGRGRRSRQRRARLRLPGLGRSADLGDGARPAVARRGGEGEDPRRNAVAAAVRRGGGDGVSIRTVLVAGGGPAGMAAALGFARSGFEVTLAEVDPQWRTAGMGLTLLGPTLRALDEIGTAEVCAAAGFPQDHADSTTRAAT